MLHEKKSVYKTEKYICIKIFIHIHEYTYTQTYIICRIACVLKQHLDENCVRDYIPIII